MFVCTWEYLVPDDRVTEFREVYDPEGPWVELSNKNRGYVRTDLLADLNNPGRFISTDFWDSRQDWENMKKEHAAEYHRIDQAAERLTQNERFVGFFQVC